jgi:DNA-binding NtrC family response regulator
MAVVCGVDDDPDILLLLKTYCEVDDDCTFHGFGSVASAREYGQWDRVDAAIVDVMMPDENGSVMLAWLATNHPHVRRVVCTAKGEMSLESLFADLAHDIVFKPFDHDTLRRAIGRHDDG